MSATMLPITYISQLDLSKSYTYDDYLTWQFKERVELIRGKLRPMSPITWRVHQGISRNLCMGIYNFSRGKTYQAYAAPFDVRLSKTTPAGDAQVTSVVQPDICVICDPAKLDEQGCVGAPEWIIEIVSPGNTAHDTKTKFDLYEENGVAEYWIVTPGIKNVAVWLLTDGRYQVHGEYYEPGPIPVHTLAGLTLEWAEIFEGV